MEKEYCEFVKQLRNEIMKATGLGRMEVCFKRAEDYPETDGDRIFVNCLVWETNCEVLALHVEELYQCFSNGNSMEEIAALVKQQYQEVKESGCLERIQDLDNYQKVCHDLIVRAINAERNEKELKDAVYWRIGDIALTVYFCLQSEDERTISMKILKPFVEKWGISEIEVFKNALHNTPLLTPPRLWNLEKMIFQAGYQGEDFMNPESDYIIRGNVYGECLSTTGRTNGATAVFVPEVAERIAQMMGCGFYAVFTSIHEVMLHGDRDVNVSDLRMALEGTLQEFTSEEEFLTKKIYHYHPETRSFTWE